MKIGVLALQGAFIEHQKMLEQLGVEVVQVRLPEQLADLDGLIIPGGESTTIGKLATQFNLIEPLRKFACEKPVWGTCAGMIFLAKNIGRDQPILNVMDIEVDRNAFGRQIDSFETLLNVAGMDEPFHAIFIRAPVVTSVNENAGVQILAKLDDGRIVAVRQGKWLATAFHPELTGDSRFHALFLKILEEEKALLGK
ncbi:MAG: pyridoxal 5'-phosphate synthase glutaminase subunit PdxT [Anaerolineae bacterium]|jgi:5'-phosphate synthase pdxT subunit|nr:MAG: pyridoxal 5'-phosphate synthase glutaminase subunit PdxT [Anaerolineae bacterium]